VIQLAAAGAAPVSDVPWRCQHLSTWPKCRFDGDHRTTLDAGLDATTAKDMSLMIRLRGAKLLASGQVLEG
jgi:hypothetical protein